MLPTWQPFNALFQSVAVPVAGVIQLAMVPADTGVMDMDLEKWNAAVKPKVNGTWNLHEALPNDLDFFVMASSLSGTFGNYGQSNYAATNTFLGAFSQFRQWRGLAASTVDLGVVDKIGFVSRNAVSRVWALEQGLESCVGFWMTAVLNSIAASWGVTLPVARASSLFLPWITFGVPVFD